VPSAFSLSPTAISARIGGPLLSLPSADATSGESFFARTTPRDTMRAPKITIATTASSAKMPMMNQPTVSTIAPV
jgi:hypothetical protein